MSVPEVSVSLYRRRALEESDLSGFERTMYAVACVCAGLFALLVGVAALLTGPVIGDAIIRSSVVTAVLCGGFGCLAVGSGIALYRRRVLGWFGGAVSLASIGVWGLGIAAEGAVHGLLTAIALTPVVWRLFTDRPSVTA